MDLSSLFTSKTGGESMTTTGNSTDGTTMEGIKDSGQTTQFDLGKTAKTVGAIGSMSKGNPSASSSGAPGSTPAAQGPMALNPAKAGKFGFESGFYGHYLPEHFKKTTIIKTTGRVR